jgi:CBS domain-containing protein
MIDEARMDWLDQIHAQAKDNQDPSVTVRELLKRFDAQRRGINVVSKIRSALAAHQLETFPDFEGEYIDNLIHFRIAKKSENALPSDQKGPVGQEPLTDVAFRIGKLPAANKTPLSVKPNQTVSEAITLMLVNDYSQLPVMTTEREVKGVVSWKSISRSLGVHGMNVDSEVRNCTDAAQVISADESLFDSIDKIVNNQYVLVRNLENKIAGIVTTSDLSLQFRQLAEPFLLLSQIENQIRQIIVRGGFTREQLRAYADRKDSKELESVQSVADLTLGEYLQLLADPQSWKQLQLSLDRTIFIHRLDTIPVIRNDVMHFDPDPISDEELATLRRFTVFLQQL